MRTQIPWPPIIRTANVPLFVRLRDLLLTILAWLIVAAFVWELIDFLWDYLSNPTFALSRSHALDWETFAQRIAFFLLAIAVLVAWLTFVGILRRKDLKHHLATNKARPLSLTEHAADFHISAQNLESWREHQIVVIHLDADNRIERIEPKP